MTNINKGMIDVIKLDSFKKTLVASKDREHDKRAGKNNSILILSDLSIKTRHKKTPKKRDGKSTSFISFEY